VGLSHIPRQHPRRAGRAAAELFVPAKVSNGLQHFTAIAQSLEQSTCVIGDPTFEATSRVLSLTPELVKGLEFDLVVLIDPEAFGKGIEGAVDRYVAMTRATRQLVILTSA
jgi:DNA helicase IV